MTAKEFTNAMANGKVDILEIMVRMLEAAGDEYCVIGGYPQLEANLPAEILDKLR